MKRLLFIFLLICQTFSFGQDNELAKLLIQIGDSVNQATLTPIEVYNKYKPIERSYLAYSQPLHIGQNTSVVNGRIELFHIIGLYASIPRSSLKDTESNTTVEEIHSAESTASLQGLAFAHAAFLDSSIATLDMDYGFIFAPISTHPLGKNIFLSLGVTTTRKSVFHTYSNNSLLNITGDLTVHKETKLSRGLDLGIKYVLPYVQVGAGYNSGGYRDGFYASAGLNIPLNVVLKRIKNNNDLKRRIKELDDDAEKFNTNNF